MIVVIRRQIRRWWQSRMPRADHWTLTQRNIYILPTKAGLAFALTLLVMLLASINYQLNLGYVLTFLLAGSGVVSMHLTHATLRGLTLRLRAPAPGFAGDAALLEVVIDNPDGPRHGIAVQFAERQLHGASVAWCDVPALGSETVRLSIVPRSRGWHEVPVLEVSSAFPLGLFRAWTVWRPAARVLAWPRPEQPAPPLPATAPAPGEPTTTSRTAGGELDGVRAWRRGDTLRQIAWKKVAHTGELVSRDTAGTGSRELWLDWPDSAGPGGGAEQRLSRLAAWVLGAERAGLSYGLRLPGVEIAPAQGDAQRRAALDALAQWA